MDQNQMADAGRSLLSEHFGRVARVPPIDTSMARPAGRAVWEYFRNDEWRNFQERVSARLETAYQKKQPLTFTGSGGDYCKIDWGEGIGSTEDPFFETKLEGRTGAKRPVRRRWIPIIHGAAATSITSSVAATTTSINVGVSGSSAYGEEGGDDESSDINDVDLYDDDDEEAGSCDDLDLLPDEAPNPLKRELTKGSGDILDTFTALNETGHETASDLLRRAAVAATEGKIEESNKLEVQRILLEVGTAAAALQLDTFISYFDEAMKQASGSSTSRSYTQSYQQQRPPPPPPSSSSAAATAAEARFAALMSSSTAPPPRFSFGKYLDDDDDDEEEEEEENDNEEEEEEHDFARAHFDFDSVRATGRSQQGSRAATPAVWEYWYDLLEEEEVAAGSDAAEDRHEERWRSLGDDASAILEKNYRILQRSVSSGNRGVNVPVVINGSTVMVALAKAESIFSAINMKTRKETGSVRRRSISIQSAAATAAEKRMALSSSARRPAAAATGLNERQRADAPAPLRPHTASFSERSPMNAPLPPPPPVQTRQRTAGVVAPQQGTFSFSGGGGGGGGKSTTVREEAGKKPWGSPPSGAQPPLLKRQLSDESGTYFGLFSAVNNLADSDSDESEDDVGRARVTSLAGFDADCGRRGARQLLLELSTATQRGDISRDDRIAVMTELVEGGGVAAARRRFSVALRGALPGGSDDEDEDEDQRLFRRFSNMGTTGHGSMRERGTISQGTTQASLDAMHGLRDEQEAAFRESLQLDREKQARKEAEAVAAAAAEAKRIRTRRRRRWRLDKWCKMIYWTATEFQAAQTDASISAEMLLFATCISATDEDVKKQNAVGVTFMLPGGKRVTRNFLKWAPISALRCFVELAANEQGIALEAVEDGDSDVNHNEDDVDGDDDDDDRDSVDEKEEEEEEEEDGKEKDKEPLHFELVAGFPPQTLSSRDRSVENFGLSGKEAIRVVIRA